MERHLLERMIGAAVLLVALVVIVPAILDGGPDVEDPQVAQQSEPAATPSDAPLRQHTIRLDRPPDSPPVARQPIDEPATPVDEAAMSEPAAQARPTPEPEPESAAVREPEPAPEAQPEPASEPQPEPASEPEVPRTPAPAERQAEAVPEPPRVVAKAPEPEPAAAEPTRVESGWVVQLGSFSNRANAEGLAARTRAKGFDTYLMPIERSGKTLYRVRVGPPRKTRGDAARLADDLRKAGFEGQVAEQRADG